MELSHQNSSSSLKSNKHEFVFYQSGYQGKYFQMVNDPIVMENVFFSKLYFNRSKEQEKEEKYFEIQQNKTPEKQDNSSKNIEFTSLKIDHLNLKREQIYFQLDQDYTKNTDLKYFNTSLGSKFSLTYYATPVEQNRNDDVEDEKLKLNKFSSVSSFSSNSYNNSNNNNNIDSNNKFINNNNNNNSDHNNKTRKIMNKSFKVTNFKVFDDKCIVQYFITETHFHTPNSTTNNPMLSHPGSNLSNESDGNKNPTTKTNQLITKKILQYELTYNVYKIENKKILLKVDILFHPSIKLPPLFDKKVAFKISSKIESEIKKQKYEVKKNTEISTIKSNRRNLMNALSDFNNIKGCEVIFTRVGKQTPKLDKVDDKWSMYYKAQSCEYHFVVKEYFESEDLDKDWIRSSYLYKSIPDTLKFSIITRLKAITPDLTLLEFIHEFDGNVESELMSVFIKDKLQFIDFIKKKMEEPISNETSK